MADLENRGDERLTMVGLLFESSAALRRTFEHRLVLDNALSSQSFDVLIRLARTPGYRLRMSELATQTSLTPSGLTRSVDRLEQAGLVARESCPDDRRGAFSVLTPHGQAVMKSALPHHMAHIDEVLEGVLTPTEELHLSDILRKIRDHLANATPACNGGEGT